MIEDVNNFNVLTTDEEKKYRLDMCNSCEMKRVDELNGNICDSCACPIEYVITYKFKICPLKKWDVE